MPIILYFICTSSSLYHLNHISYYGKVMKHDIDVKWLVFNHLTNIQDFQEDFPMAIDKVKAYFKEFGLEDKIQEFEVSSATVALAAQALSCKECRI